MVGHQQGQGPRVRPQGLTLQHPPHLRAQQVEGACNRWGVGAAGGHLMGGGSPGRPAGLTFQCLPHPLGAIAFVNR